MWVGFKDHWIPGMSGHAVRNRKECFQSGTSQQEGEELCSGPLLEVL
jgi:hypothetical protein